MPHQGVGLADGAIGDDEQGRAHLEQWPDDAPRRAAGAENQDLHALEREFVVDRKVAQQPDAVGIVAIDFAVAKGKRIGGTCRRGSLRQVVTELDDFTLVRGRDVETLPSLTLEPAHRLLEFAGLDPHRRVLDVFTGLLGEQPMDHRRAAVRYRVTDDAVTVGRRHWVSASQRAASFAK